MALKINVLIVPEKEKGMKSTNKLKKPSIPKRNNVKKNAIRVNQRKKTMFCMIPIFHH